jgi:hypothetical protein
MLKSRLHFGLAGRSLPEDGEDKYMETITYLMIDVCLLSYYRSTSYGAWNILYSRSSTVAKDLYKVEW